MDTVKSEAATITGYVEGVATTMMLDLESSVSVLKRFAFKDIKYVKIRPILKQRL